MDVRGAAADLTAAAVRVEGLAAGYTPGEPVLAGLDFELPAGDCLAVVGRSGCGKSTLLHVLAGLLAPAAGTLEVGGRAAYMFQRDLLLPWKSALQNVVFPAAMSARAQRLGGRGRHAAGRLCGRRPETGVELERRGRALLEEFGLGDALDAAPAELSGGMRQRVALARTVLLDRGLILLDEPFGSLDAVTRAEMRRWLLQVMAAHPATWVLVTHDVDEAVLLGDHVAVLHGRPARLEGWRRAVLSRVDRARLAAAALGDDDADSGTGPGCDDGAAARLLATAAADVRHLLRPRDTARAGVRHESLREP